MNRQRWVLRATHSKLASTLIVFGRPFFFKGPIYVSASINLSDFVTGIVDCRRVFLGGFIFAFVLIWIDARVSRVVSAIYDCASVEEGLVMEAGTLTCNGKEDASGCVEYCCGKY